MLRDRPRDKHALDTSITIKTRHRTQHQISKQVIQLPSSATTMTSTNIPRRQLGKNGPMVPALGLGLMGLSIAYGKVGDDEERFKLLDRAVELGATNWDSSE